ncbi:MAG: DUF4332 domain-containing protein [Anaerolineaceae bacterium]|nr:DUF4332 domain-containing protein [Anaerolineaceae bacterium]
MGKQYHIDLKRYSLQKFQRDLENREMIPSRVSLKYELDKRFRKLEDKGIENLQGLLDELKTNLKIEKFSKHTGLTREYLILIKREVKSYLSNPIRLDKFSGIPKENFRELENIGIKNSRQFLLEAGDQPGRARLSQRSGVSLKVINELAGLSDLSRAYGVGPVFARMLYDVGIKSIAEFIKFTPEKIINIYESHTKKKADFGENEMWFSLKLAKELDIFFE